MDNSNIYHIIVWGIQGLCHVYKCLNGFFYISHDDCAVFSKMTGYVLCMLQYSFFIA